MKVQKGKIRIKKIKKILSPVFWFIVGVATASFCLVTFFLIYFNIAFKDRVIPGVFVGKINVGKMSTQEVQNIFDEKNKKIGSSKITFVGPEDTATVSANLLHIGYNSSLISEQVINIGKSGNFFSDGYYIINSYLNGTFLSPSYTLEEDKLKTVLDPMQKKVFVEPVDALFQVQNNRVSAFKESQDGKTIDFESLSNALGNALPTIINGDGKNIVFAVPIKILQPKITTEKANKFGIVEEIGTGTSAFAHSIPNRIYNVALAASRVNGILVAPDEEFSFVKYLGDVSKFTGYKEAYIISGGKTILGDGGGVCQVSTTLFRAILNAGLTVTERHAHAYRVGYYEQDSLPGIDATVYVPSVDLKFKNDTGNYILIQSLVNQDNQTMSFSLYGTKDGREVAITQPVISSQTPAPETVYQDDPTLPKGVEKQIDFAAAGAVVSFSRTVKKNGKVIIQEIFKSNYRPWRAVFLRGTKEG